MKYNDYLVITYNLLYNLSDNLLRDLQNNPKHYTAENYGVSEKVFQHILEGLDVNKLANNIQYDMSSKELSIGPDTKITFKGIEWLKDFNVKEILWQRT